MKRRKTSSGIVLSVFAEKESNASAALIMGIRRGDKKFARWGRLPEKSLR